VQSLGVKEDGVSAAIDEHNKALITPEMLAAVEKAKADIIAWHRQGSRLHIGQRLPEVIRA
jgi:basic membrane lipoprotein Med (substrate-binding protein (PBP1-ABC) superfamily)